MVHIVSGISFILILLTVSSAMGTAWGQNYSNSHEQELLDELTGIRNSLTDASNSNTTSSFIALAIGLILGGIAAFTAIHQTSNLKKQLATLERQVETIENESEIRMRPIIVRDVFPNGRIYELKESSVDSEPKLSIRMVNRGPTLARELTTRFEWHDIDEHEGIVYDTMSYTGTDSIRMLGPGEHVVYTTSIPEKCYNAITNKGLFGFRFNMAYTGTKSGEEYGYVMNGFIQDEEFYIDVCEIY